MVILVDNYTFDASAKTITFDDYVTIDLINVESIKNITVGKTIYLPNTEEIGSVATNVFTFTSDNTDMNNIDVLEIYYEDSTVTPTDPITIPQPLAAEIAGPFGQQTMANSIPAVLASDQPPITVTGTITIDTSLLSTKAKQDTGNTSLASIDTKLTSPLAVTGTFWQATQPVSGTFWQATQPISVATLPLPTGASTSALQTTENGYLASIDGKIIAVNTGAVVIASSALPSGAATSSKQDSQTALLTTIDGHLDVVLSTRLKAADTLTAVTTVGTITNVVHVDDNSGSITVDAPVATPIFVRLSDGSSAIVTLPVSLAALPALVAGSALIGKVGIDQTTPGTTNKVSLGSDVIHTIIDSATLGTVTMSGTVTSNAGTNLNTSLLGLETTQSSIKTSVELIDNAISGAGFNITQLGGTNIDTNSGTKSAGTQRVVIATDQPNLTTALNVAGPTLTKATQGSTGFSTQDLKDAGRVAKRYYAVAAAAGTTTTETAITLTLSSQDAATSTGTSFTPTTGKTFRITAITFATRGHATATIQTTTFNLRMNTAGAVTTSSTPILLSMRSATPATASAWDRVYVEIPDGMEIYGDGTKQWGVTAASTYTTNAPTWDVTIIGYEY